MPLEIAASGGPLRLDLGCGKTPAADFEGVDFFEPSAKHQVDLFRFPWPWEDDSVEEIRASHFVQRIPAVYVAADGKTYRDVPQDPGDRDLLLRFFDEAYRVLRPGRRFTVIVPSGQSGRAFQDPTHRRVVVPDTFSYLHKATREMFGRGGGDCDFAPIVEFLTTPDEDAFHDEVQAKRRAHFWNTVIDIKATLTSLKPTSRHGLPGSLQFLAVPELVQRDVKQQT